MIEKQKKINEKFTEHFLSSKKESAGFSLIEIIIASAVMLIVWLTVFYTFSVLTQFTSKNTNSIKASMLLEEGSEAIRSLRDLSWKTNIAPLGSGVDYQLSYSTSTDSWTVVTDPSMIDGKFDRTFSLSDVSRDPSTFNVVSSGGVFDADSKRVDITVSWYQGSATTSESLETYIFNDFDN